MLVKILRNWISYTLLLGIWNRKMVQPFWKTVCQFLKKLNTSLPFNPVVYSRAFMSMRNESLCSHKNLHKWSLSSFTWDSSKLEIIQISFKEKVVKLWCIHTVGYNSVIKRNELLILTKTWMNLKEIMLSEESHMCYVLSFM